MKPKIKSIVLNTIAYLIVTSIFLAIFYFTGVLISMNFNPALWHWALRLILIIPSGIGFVRVTLLYIKQIREIREFLP